MLPMLSKHKMITAALLATLTLSACGKKKDVLVPPPSAPQKTESEVPAPIDETEMGDTNGQIGGGLPSGEDENVGASADYAPPSESEPTPLPDPEEEESQQGTSNQPVVKRPITPPVVENRPLPSQGSNPLPSDYEPNKVSNINREGLSKRLTGGVTPEGLVYTSSATDELLDFLRARNQRVGQESRRLNEQAAASVVFAKLSVDSLSGDGIVTLKVQEGGEVRVYNLVGSAASGPANTLRKVSAGNGTRTSGSRALEGTLKCVDFDGQCDNVFVRLKIGSSPNSAIINVVFRSSRADLHYSMPGQRSGSPEYETLRRFILNSINQNNSENRLEEARMSSWEVVNGRAGVTLTIRARNQELLGFAAPLLAPEAGTGVNIRVARLAKDQEESLDLVSTRATKLNYANWIADARLVANNGLGQVRLALKMRRVGRYSQDQFAVTFMRRIKPIVELTDDELR